MEREDGRKRWVEDGVRDKEYSRIRYLQIVW